MEIQILFFYNVKTYTYIFFFHVAGGSIYIEKYYMTLAGHKDIRILNLPTDKTSTPSLPLHFMTFILLDTMT